MAVSRNLNDYPRKNNSNLLKIELWHLFIIKKKSLRTIAKILGYAVSWVKKWVDRYKAGGVENLFDQPRSGRPQIINEENIPLFVERIKNGPTEKDETFVFTVTDIKEILEKEYGASYSMSGVYSLLHRLKFAKIRPRPRHYKKDEKQVEEWLNSFPAKIEEIQRTHFDKKIVFYFQDEVRFGNQGELSSVWALKGTEPIVEKQNGRMNAYIFGAVNPISGAHVGFISEVCSTEAMNIHLGLISDSIKENTHGVIIMDGASWHERSTELIVPSNISIITLPPYSPELNPIERLWKYLKSKKLKNRVIPKKMDMLDLGKELWDLVNNELIKSLCRASYIPFTN